MKFTLPLALATLLATLLTAALAAPAVPADLAPTTPAPPPNPDLFYPCKFTSTCVYPGRCDQLCGARGLKFARLETCGYAPIRFWAKCCCR